MLLNKAVQMTISGEQCRMARAALGLGIRDLAILADMSPNTIARLERGEVLHKRTQIYLRGALEAEGVAFVAPGEASLSGGAGVRRADSAQLSPMADIFERLWNVSPKIKDDPAGAFEAMLEIVGRYLGIIASERREPDTWERIDLAEALAELERDHLSGAIGLIRRGITPPDNQSSDYPTPASEAARVVNYDLAFFGRRVVNLRTRGYRPRGVQV